MPHIASGVVSTTFAQFFQASRSPLQAKPHNISYKSIYLFDPLTPPTPPQELPPQYFVALSGVFSWHFFGAGHFVTLGL